MKEEQIFNLWNDTAFYFYLLYYNDQVWKNQLV